MLQAEACKGLEVRQSLASGNNPIGENPVTGGERGDGDMHWGHVRQLSHRTSSVGFAERSKGIHREP